MVKDATASYSVEHMHANLGFNILNYAGAIVTTQEIVDAISASRKRWARVFRCKQSAAQKGDDDKRQAEECQFLCAVDCMVIVSPRSGEPLRPDEFHSH